MKTTIIDKQKDFEKQVAKILGFTDISQREFSEQMIIYTNDDDDMLTGTIGFKKKKANVYDIILIVTKDSEVNYVEKITPKMLDLMISLYTSFKDGDHCLHNFNNKVIFCTNLPIDIHSSKAKDLKEQYNFHIQNIGYSFCEKHKLEYCEMY